MSRYDVVVVGGGISGCTFAFESARAGRETLLLESASQVGGCLATHRTPSGFWYELGAHTCYNSYVGLAEVVEGCGLRGEVVQRAKSHLRFLDGDRLLPGSNLGALLRLFSWGEMARAAPQMLLAVMGRLPKDGQTVYSYYSRIVGRKNYGNVLGPMLSAVPSQSADAFPAGMLFKSRAQRRKDLPRSFTLRAGLMAIPEAVMRQPRVTVATGQPVARVELAGNGFAVVTEAGERHEAGVVALATPPGAAARLLRGAAPELAMQVARVKEAAVESFGAAVQSDKVDVPPSTFLIPRDDVFHSVVTRDSLPDPGRRAFVFHFKPGLARDEKLRRAAAVLRVKVADLEDVSERTSVLPSPVLGHEEVVREVDRISSGSRLCITGNWFAGLSIEDCVERSRQEWARAVALG